MNTKADYINALSTINPIHVLRLRDWVVSVGANHIDRRSRSLVLDLGSTEITVPNEDALQTLRDALESIIEGYRTDIKIVSEQEDQIRVLVSGACPILRVTKSDDSNVTADDIEEIKNAVSLMLPNRVTLHIEAGADTWDPTEEDLKRLIDGVEEAFDGTEGIDAVIATRRGVRMHVAPSYACVECSSCD